MEGIIFELDLEGSISGGRFPGRKGILGRGNSELRQGGSEELCLLLEGGAAL